MVKKENNSWVSWSEEELRLLKRLFPRGEARQIVEKTGRPLSAVRQKAYSMGLATRPKGFWSDSETEIVRTLYPTENTQNIADRLGRSVERVAAKAHSIGIRKTKPPDPPWSKQEDALLRKLYPDQENTTANIAKQTGRSVSAIVGRAHILGIRRQNSPWSKKEVALLRKLYLTHQDKEIAAKIGRSAGAVGIRRFKLGLRKRKRKA